MSLPSNRVSRFAGSTSLALFSCLALASISCKTRTFGKEQSITSKETGKVLAKEFYLKPELTNDVSEAPTGLFQAPDTLMFAKSNADTFVCFASVEGDKDIKWSPLHEKPISFGEFYQTVWNQSSSEELKAALKGLDEASLNLFAYTLKTMVAEIKNTATRQNMERLFADFVLAPSQATFEKVIAGTAVEHKVNAAQQALRTKDIGALVEVARADSETFLINGQKAVQYVQQASEQMKTLGVEGTKQKIQEKATGIWGGLRNKIDKKVGEAKGYLKEKAEKDRAARKELITNGKQAVTEKIEEIRPKNREEALAMASDLIRGTQFAAAQAATLYVHFVKTAIDNGKLAKVGYNNFMDELRADTPRPAADADVTILSNPEDLKSIEAATADMEQNSDAVVKAIDPKKLGNLAVSDEDFQYLTSIMATLGQGSQRYGDNTLACSLEKLPEFAAEVASMSKETASAP